MKGYVLYVLARLETLCSIVLSGKLPDKLPGYIEGRYLAISEHHIYGKEKLNLILTLRMIL